MESVAKYFGFAPSYEPKNKPAKKASGASMKRSRSKAVSIKASAVPKSKRSSTMRLPRGAKLVSSVRVTKTDYEKALQTIKEVSKLPTFVIRAHSCLCPFGGRKCFGAEIPPTFDIPNDTFVVSFAQSGEAACPTEKTIFKYIDSIRNYLYLHSQGDFEDDPDGEVGKQKFSFFSGVRRAVGPIPYSNISYTLNEWVTNPDGSKMLMSADGNPWGIYEVTSRKLKGVDWKLLNNTMSILPQDETRTDWTLEQIINEVYAKRRISKALFISTGCLITCEKQHKAKTKEAKELIRKDVQRHGDIMDHANTMYVNLRETLTKAELRAHGLKGVQNVGVGNLQAYPDPTEYEEMIEEGLTNKAALKVLLKTVHEENREQLGLPAK